MRPSNENVIQKNKLSDINLEYKIFTNQHDEITKAENLENFEDAVKLRKTLDQQLIEHYFLKKNHVKDLKLLS